MSAFEAYFQSIQKACLPGVWSRAVTMARELTIIEDRRSDEEIALRVLLPHKPVSPKVTLWPSDEDWHCNCGDRNDPCIHIAAAAIAIKNGVTRSASPEESGGSEALAVKGASLIAYRFKRQGKVLVFERWIRSSESELLLTQSLVSYVGGISSGRIASASVAATREDYGVDQILNERKGGILPQTQLARLIPALSNCSNVSLDGKPITASSRSIASALVITDERMGEESGFRIRLAQDAAPEQPPEESFDNGAVLRGTVLHACTPHALSEIEIRVFSGQGKFFSRGDLAPLAGQLLPSLEHKIQIENRSRELPKGVEVAPRIVLETRSDRPGHLVVVPVIVYGNPPIARIDFDRLQPLSRQQIPIRDEAAERSLVRRLQMDLQLAPGQPLQLEGEAAIRFLSEVSRSREWEVSGTARSTFEAKQVLQPRVELGDTRGFSVRFETESGEADPELVLKTWRTGGLHVPLLNGNWAKLPSDWLDRYGSRIATILQARGSRKESEVPAFLAPELVSLCQELGAEVPIYFEQLKARLSDFHQLPPAPLPGDLKAELRDYQKTGVNWLSFLREHQMGAMLADDMGLGKTLQALCVLKAEASGSRTLIVVPTSVVGSWCDQLMRFRPGLQYEIYHGSGRALSDQVPVVITTYAILRLDREALAARVWDTVILDEAQTIRNPESQVSRAAHALQAQFRVALSGTPIENRMEDLWSQFQFLNPGLLGTLQDFRSEFVDAVSAGNSEAGARLHRRIRPFIMRRLKKEVAAELPPRIETVLDCELSTVERELYESILAASRVEVLRQLDSGGGVLGALEVLLRLRQVCCHSGLVPGQHADSSAKLELLLETLETSIEEGHRSLVFSQWTSFLDLIEPHLAKRNIPFLRLDGSTPDRNAVVSRFQDENGPPVLLMSLKAGGVGLTLTEADHVFLLDPWWNPAAENQASDRAHRIGQKHTVMIHRLVAKNTVEERVLALQKAKAELAQAVMQGGALSQSLTRDDIVALLAP